MTDTTSQSVSYQMASFALGTSWSSLPERVQAESIRALVNWVACAVGGAVTPLVDAAVKGVKLTESNAAAPLIGRRERVSMPNAALIACISSTAHTFDDTHLATITHPTGPVAAAIFAASHALSLAGKPVSGSNLLASLAVGVELECRLSNAIAAGGQSHMGWYMTGLSGGVGAAAAVARLLGLTKVQTVSCIGLAGAQACGLRATHGSMAIAYVPGLAARNGLVSAYMAAADFTCSGHAIDGRNGLLQVLSPTAAPDLINKRLGIEFELMNNAYKPYPCGIVIHPAIDACLKLVKNPSARVDAVVRIHLSVHPDAMNLTWRKLPNNELDAQVSLYHWVAAALIFGQAGVAEGELASVMDARVRALQEIIEVTVDNTLRSNQAVVLLRMQDGSSLEHKTENAIGSISNPMTREQLISKFAMLTQPCLGVERSTELLDFCESMPTALDAADIFCRTV